MRHHIYGIGTAVLLCAVIFDSCTCEKAVAPPSANAPLSQKHSGFHATDASQTPQQHVQAPPTATPQQMAAPPTATPQQVAAETPPADLPQDFPVPVFAGASVAQVQNLANDAHNVIFRTAAPTVDVYNFYQNKLTREGWQVTQDFQRGAHAFMSFKKGDMVANVTIAEDPNNPGQQILAVMYEQEKPLDFDEF